ncbi:hypothetical protein Tco_0215376 [Tanacetum coccineum]
MEDISAVELSFEEVKKGFDKLVNSLKTKETGGRKECIKVLDKDDSGRFRMKLREQEESVQEDGTDIVYINFGAMLKDISRDDLTELYRIVMNRYGMDGPEDETMRRFLEVPKGWTSHELTATVEMVFSRPWTYTFLVAKGLTTPELMANWGVTATARTLDNGEIELTATIDGKVKIVTEASVRRHLQLADSDGISSLPTTKIFEQLSLMGPKKTSWEQFSSNIATAIICLATNRKFIFIQVFLNKHKRLLQPHTRLYIAPTHTQKLFSNMKRASKGYTGENIPLFPAMIVQGPVVQGEGSTHPVESHYTPISALSTSQPPSLPTSRRINIHESVVLQTRSPTQSLVADEAASTGVDVRYRGATILSPTHCLKAR